MSTVTTSYTMFDFGYGKYAPVDGNLDDYLGRLVVSYNEVGVIVRVREAAMQKRRMDGSVIPNADALVIFDRGDEHGPDGQWIQTGDIAEPSVTVLHWHSDLEHREPYEERERLHALFQEADRLRRAAREGEQQSRERRVAEADATWKRITPDWAKAYIVAELKEDMSDIQTDYFASRTVRTVVLGFSKTTRNSFPEMRKFAALFPETAHLVEEGTEHREDYSGGSGLYLAGEGGKYSGWIVRKYRFWSGTPQGQDVEFLPSLIEK